MLPSFSAPRRAHPGYFLAIFAVCYLAFYWAYFMIPDKTLTRWVYEPLIVAPTALVINTLTPGEQVSFAGNRINSARAILDVVRGCDGIGLILLLASAILAFPSSAKMKLFGVLVGTLFMYGLNLGRIAILYYVVAYYGKWFIPLHTLVIPGGLVLLAGVYFHLWTSYAMRPIHSGEQS